MLQELFEQRKLCLHKQLKRQIKTALKRFEACQQELQVCQNWQALAHEGSLLQANLYRIEKGSKQALVLDWQDDGKERKISLDPLLSPSEQIAKIFRKAKKRRLAIPHLIEQGEKRQKFCESLLDAERRLCEIATEEELLEWESAHAKGPGKAPKAAKEKSLPYHEFHTATNLLIRVGKGAKSNDQLTFTIAKGSDLWFHVRDFPGSHVVLSVARGQEADFQSIQDAACLAAAYSKARDEKEAEVVVAECKYVKRIKGAPPGKVSLSKHRIMRIRQDLDRLKVIKKQRPEA